MLETLFSTSICVNDVTERGNPCHHPSRTPSVAGGPCMISVKFYFIQQQGEAHESGDITSLVLNNKKEETKKAFQSSQEPITCTKVAKHRVKITSYLFEKTWKRCSFHGDKGNSAILQDKFKHMGQEADDTFIQYDSILCGLFTVWIEDFFVRE